MRASTGPKTAEGKARASQNARKHGLNVPVRRDRGLSATAKDFARELAGANAPSEVLERALRVAEAHIDIMRIRQTRYKLMIGEPLDPEREEERSRALFERKRRRLREAVSYFGPFGAMPADLAKELSITPEDAEKPTPVLSEIAAAYIILDRYERRALSRRKFAIRDLDAVRVKQIQLGKPRFGKTNPN